MSAALSARRVRSAYESIKVQRGRNIVQTVTEPSATSDHGATSNPASRRPIAALPPESLCRRLPDSKCRGWESNPHDPLGVPGF